jgi:hypothetical protein
MLFLLFLFFCGFSGCMAGLEVASSGGFWGHLLGALVGFVAGVLGAVLVGLLAALTYTPIEWFRDWWRPYPPVCANGCCRGLGDYQIASVPDEVCAAKKGMSRVGWRCQCGNLYAGGYAHGFLNRFVRILPDGSIRLYLKHRILGRWVPDDGVGIEGSRLEKALDRLDKVQIPAWLIPFLSCLLLASVAAAGVGMPGLATPIGVCLVLVSATMGLLAGSIAWWIEARSKK